MNQHSLLFRLNIAVVVALFSLVFCACGDESGSLSPSVDPKPGIYRIDSIRLNTDIYRQHSDAPLKILAIGNSFTENASTYIPWLTDRIVSDSVCFARLTRSGCSLSQHWTSHVTGSPDYNLNYTVGDKWQLSEIKTIDGALDILDWDIIVIQQASGESGRYVTYQPYLDNLLLLFRETNPSARLVWHCTWPYRDGTTHPYFKDYGNDPLTMYRGILDACGRIADSFDIVIPSATLIWEMRKAYPEVENQFSADGYHISDPLALFALSSLWYEYLIAPATGTSCILAGAYPPGVDPDAFARALDIIRSLLPSGDPGDPDSVPMLPA